ncbi:unnamed protein product [Tenebrio molitor]|nr:unnamed protein product [Tenebrio molitor]
MRNNNKHYAALRLPINIIVKKYFNICVYKEFERSWTP